MLSKSKISKYKVKKILECFVEDYSSAETSKITRLNIKTTNRYYKLFRNILRRLFMELIDSLPLSSNYIGYLEDEYVPENFLSIHKLSKKVFLPILITKKPSHKKFAIKDEDFYNFAKFIYSRFSKFHGLTFQNYYFQNLECVVRYNYSQDELFEYTWKNLIKSSKCRQYN